MKLSIVATPIGNLEDITLRAIRTLESVDRILCEDTRVTKKLLARHHIDTPTLSYHEYSGKLKTDHIFELLEKGEHLALVTDAGTPGISDPGAFLVEQARSKFGDELTIEVIPGPSSLTAAIAVSGVRADTFTFFGFLPHKKGRETLFGEMTQNPGTMVFYESPHRIVRTLEALSRHLGTRQVCLCRELTKVHEEVLSGSAADILETLHTHPEKIRGECVIIVAPES